MQPTQSFTLSDQIYDLVQAVAATASLKEKEQLLAPYRNDLEVRRVLEYCYNPRKVYNLYQFSNIQYNPNGQLQFSPFVWDLLDQIAGSRKQRPEKEALIYGLLQQLTPKSQDLLLRILRKNLRAGISEGIINKVFSGLVPTFPYMRCSSATKRLINAYLEMNGYAFLQEKLDGLYIAVERYSAGQIRMITRQGNELPVEAFGVLQLELSRLKPNTQTHGEIVVYKRNKLLHRKDSNGILNRVANGGNFEADEKPVYVVWDQISLDEAARGESDFNYQYRYDRLVEQVGENSISQLRMVYTEKLNSLEEIMAAVGRLLKQKKEGGVVKNPSGMWIDGTSPDQCKVKPHFDVDLIVRAILPGKLGTRNEGKPGSLQCTTSDNLLSVDVAIKDFKMRDRITATPGEFVGRIMEVRANDIIETELLKNTLYLPRFVENTYRIDKHEADSLIRVHEQRHAVLNGKFELPER